MMVSKDRAFTIFNNEGYAIFHPGIHKTKAMCTVTYIRTGNEIILTANRDELTSRAAALPPRKYLIRKKKVIYPEDPVSNGSWFAVDEYGNSAIVLNGADEKHLAAPPYLKSRGLILTDLIGRASPLGHWAAIDLRGIEPFTIILSEQNNLYQLSWNGSAKMQLGKDPRKDHIWSSATLYDAGARAQRRQWLNDFRLGKEVLSGDDMLYFHRNTRSVDKVNGLMMNRDNHLRTLSITQARITPGMVDVHYFQVMPEETHLISMPLK